MKELVVLVNDNNEQIGVLPKEKVHHANTQLHRAFSAYVFNQKGEFLLTQRALSKKVFPGMWTNSCCGHPGPDEPTEDAITRRLAFELGLVPQSIHVILPHYRYRAEMNGIVENEICPVYLVTVTTDPERNPDEVEKYVWMDWDMFVKDVLHNPQKYSAWCRGQVEELSKNKKFLKFLTEKKYE